MSQRNEHEIKIAIGGKVDNSLPKSVEGINKKLDTIGSTIKAVVAVASTAFATDKILDWAEISVDASKEFGTSMAGVAKVVDGLKDDNGKATKSFYEMKDSILDMSKDLPKTAEDIAAIIEAAGQSNIEKSELAQFAEDATKMGIAFDSTAEHAGEWMAAWRTALKFDQTGVVTLADQINYLGNTTSENAIKISEVVTSVGSLAGTAGITASSVAAIAASMTKVDSNVASTGIKNLALALVSGESATKRQIKGYKTLGLEAKKTAKNMQVDSQGTIIDVLERISKLDKDKQASTLKNIFGSESLSSIAPLLANLDNLKEQFNKVGDSALYAGSMEKEYISASSTAANVDVLRDNKIRAMQIQIGDTLVPLSTLASETTGNIAEAFGNFVNDNAPAIQVAVKHISDTFKEFAPNAVYTLKELANNVGEFFEGFKPIGDWILDNPSVVPNFLKSVGASLVTYKIGKNISEIAKNAKAAESPLKLLSGVITNPWALAIGAVAGGIALIATSVNSARKELQSADLASRFGDISLSLEDLDGISKELLYNDNFGKLSESLDMKDSLASLKDSIDDIQSEINKYNWKVSIGLTLSEEEKATYQNNITTYISETQKYLEDNHYALNLALDVFTDNDETGRSIVESSNRFYLENQATLEDLGKQLQEAVNNSFSDGLLTIDEVKTISELQKKMSLITSKMAQSKFEATLEVMSTKAIGNELTPESYKNFIAEMQEQSKETIADYDESLTMVIANAKVRLDAGEISKEEYDKEVAEYKKNYLEDIGQVNLTVSQFATDTLFKSYGNEIKSALPKLNEKVSNVVAENENVLGMLLANGEYGSVQTYISQMAEEIQKLGALNPEVKSNLLAKYKESLPTKEELVSVANSYIQENKEVPQQILDEINEIIMIGALGGDEESIYTLIGAKIGEDSEYKQLLIKASELGVDVPEQIITSLDSKFPDIELKTKEIKRLISNELENGLYLDIPINTTLKPNIFDITSTSSVSKLEKALGKNSKLPGYKDGAIITRPTIATFAEEGPEAAIPLDGSSNAISLWQMAGQILGVFDRYNYYGDSGYSIPDAYNRLVNNTSTNNVTNTPTLKVEYHINVESGADYDKVQKAVSISHEQFEYLMDFYNRNKGRTRMIQED